MDRYCVHWFINGPKALATTKEPYASLPEGIHFKKQYGFWIGSVNEDEWLKVHRLKDACPKGWEVGPAPGGPFTGSAPGLYDECKRPLPATAEAGLTITKVEDGLQRTSV